MLGPLGLDPHGFRRHPLESLEIHFMGDRYDTVAPLLDSLFLPTLHELILFYLLNGEESLHGGLMSLLLRSSCPLVGLDLQVYLSEPQLIECLVILPFLKELKLGGR